MNRIKNFKPICELNEEDKTIVCRPEWEEDGKTFKVEKDIVLRREGEKATIVNSGDAKDEILDMTRKHIEDRLL